MIGDGSKKIPIRSHNFRFGFDSSKNIPNMEIKGFKKEFDPNFKITLNDNSNIDNEIYVDSYLDYLETQLRNNNSEEEPKESDLITNISDLCWAHDIGQIRDRLFVQRIKSLLKKEGITWD